MGQIQITISLVLIALFSIALVGFAVNFASDNDTAVSISDDPELSTLDTQVRGNLTEFTDKSSEQYQSIIESTIESGEVVQSVGPFAVTPISALGTVTNILKVGYMKIFGNASGFNIFIMAFFSVLLFVIGLFLYKTLRGNPD